MTRCDQEPVGKLADLHALIRDGEDSFISGCSMDDVLGRHGVSRVLSGTSSILTFLDIS